MKGKRDNRYAAILALAIIIALVFLVYNRGHISQPWTKSPYGEEKSFPGFPVDINSADIDALLLLPGVGTKTAEAIIEKRQKKGGFAVVEDIRNVSGIGKEKFNRMKGFKFKKKGAEGVREQ